MMVEYCVKRMPFRGRSLVLNFDVDAGCPHIPFRPHMWSPFSLRGSDKARKDLSMSCRPASGFTGITSHQKRTACSINFIPNHIAVS
jgi:hypothetical protein